MPEHVEERAWVLRFSLEARFPADYDGDLDGYVWHRAWDERVRPALLQAVLAELRRQSGWRFVVRNRGLPADREVEIVVAPELERDGPAGP